MAHRTIEAEDVLKAAYALQVEGGTWDDTALVHSMGLPEAMARGVTATLVAAGWAEKDRYGRRRLTEAGKARARELVRAHRLWERYLIDEQGGVLRTCIRRPIAANARRHPRTWKDWMPIQCCGTPGVYFSIFWNRMVVLLLSSILFLVQSIKPQPATGILMKRRGQ